MKKMENTTATTNATATTTKKLTKKDYFGMLSALVEKTSVDNKDAILDFIAHEVNLLEKKSTKKSSNVQKANEVILDTILTVLGELDKPVTVSDLLGDTRLEKYTLEEKGETKEVKMSGQKLSALITSLVKKGSVIRTVDKKKAYFAIAK